MYSLMISLALSCVGRSPVVGMEACHLATNVNNTACDVSHKGLLL